MQDGMKCEDVKTIHHVKSEVSRKYFTSNSTFPLELETRYQKQVKWCFTSEIWPLISDWFVKSKGNVVPGISDEELSNTAQSS